MTILAAPALPFRINWTGSMPLGLYRVRPAEIRSGSRVLACLPGSTARLGQDRGYLSRGSCSTGHSPVLKAIAALPGECVELRIDSLVVNGVATAATRLRERDGRGRPLAHAPVGVSRVSDGEVWLLELRSDRSWDSRYFGPVPLASILGSADPILTWGGDE
jgi:conjugative transfer signal peptidase TraF